MAFRHGSHVTEVPTSLSVPIVASATLPVVFGTAPINLASSTEYVNKPLIAYSLGEAQTALGYSNDWENYTLCEMMDAAFRQFNIAPIVFINVLDPAVHKKESTEVLNLVDKKVAFTAKGILLDSLVVKINQADETALIRDEDFLAEFDDDGNLILAIIEGGKVQAVQNTLYATFNCLAPEMVTADDIIGGYNVQTGHRKGLELLNAIFPKFGLVPAQVLAPKYSKDPVVSSVMKAKASAINTYFRGFAWDDVDTKVANAYSKAIEWKNTNNYTAANEAPCWPMVGLGDKKYHLSTQMACLVVKVAISNGDYPHESPSNKSLAMNKLILEDGTEVDLGPDQAELLNSQGITTALNFIGGWVAWGNCTGAFPYNNDVKDMFIPVRITHNWIANTIILTTWKKVDGPITRRLIDNIVDTMNFWFNGLQSAGVVLGGRVEFRKDDNPTTDLLGGKIKFRYFTAEPTPAQEIENLLEFDPGYYSTLF